MFNKRDSSWGNPNFITFKSNSIKVLAIDSKLRKDEEVIEKLVNLPELKVIITHRKPSL